MTMEVPPFHRPKPAWQHFLRGVQNPRGNKVQDSGHWCNGRGKSLWHRLRRAACLPCDAQFWRRKWGASTRLETRTKESNRRAREKIIRCQYFSRTERESACRHGVHTNECPTPTGPHAGVAFECACLDPKGGELCLNKVKPGETQVEACSDADVQIARMIWVSERKTHRTT